jgi:hypothetical protein
LATVNSTTINMSIQVISYELRLHLFQGMISLDQMVVLFSVFWENSVLISVVAGLIHIPISNEFVSPHIHVSMLFFGF